MNVARINFSHGTHDEQAELIHRIRKISHAIKHPAAILLDLQGPKIRIGKLAKSEVMLVSGETLTLTTEAIIGNKYKISVDYDDLPNSVQLGNRILLDDGKIELKVKTVGVDAIETEIIIGGILKPHKGVNIPGGDLSIQAFT